MTVVAGAGLRVAGRLDGLDFTVAQGEFVALLGPNGAGKTTLVRCVLGLTPYDAGSVELFGTPLPRFREWPRIGFVPQRSAAAPGVPATVREVVRSGRTPRVGRGRRFGAGDRAAVDAALDLAGLTELAGRSVATLSGGQQQRVLIARAFAGSPELLVLDEPTTGVDAASHDQLVAALRDYRDRGNAVLLVAHELGALDPLVDRYVALATGRVVYDGAAPPAALVAPAHHHAAEAAPDGWLA